MGFFSGKSESGGHHHRSHSSSRSIFGGSSSGHKHNSSSIFGSGDHNKSTTSFFSAGGSKSHRRASPRSGYLNRVYKQLRRLLRDLLYYLKRHPMKVFMLVIMPLITGGALTGLLRKFGIRMPMGMTKMFGGMGGMMGGTGIGRGKDGDLQFERTSYEGHGSSSGLGTAMSIAKMFM